MSAVYLVITAGPDIGRVFSVQDGETLVIGRGQDSGTQLRDARVSRRHCLVECDRGTLRVTDSGGAGGTLVNDQAITEQELQPGDVVRIGDTQLRLQLEPPADTGATINSPPPVGSGTSPPDENLSNLVGRTFHRYQIEQQLAHGKTGAVFLAKDTKKGLPLALKVLWPSISRDKTEMQRFVRAMKTMHPIEHPNIIRVYNAGVSDSLCWVAMEYVDGESLTEVIDRIGTAGMLDWRTAFRVTVHITRALQAAFENRIIHRNITPANILLRSADKVAKLGDLMLAKALEGTMAEQVTRPGQLVGEVAYMAPERTKSAADADCRSDIYGLGATAYALLTGRPPFEGVSLPELISKIRNEDPVKPKEFQLSIADMFQDSVLQMLAKRPEDRYQTPAHLLKDLERISQFQGIEV